jgi:predicted enzyme related to lactoylglutathione lyase
VNQAEVKGRKGEPIAKVPTRTLFGFSPMSSVLSWGEMYVADMIQVYHLNANSFPVQATQSKANIMAGMTMDNIDAVSNLVTVVSFYGATFSPKAALSGVKTAFKNTTKTIAKEGLKKGLHQTASKVASSSKFWKTMFNISNVARTFERSYDEYYNSYDAFVE